jgi:hypothetical protein
MRYVNHKNIKRFSLIGEIHDDGAILRLRNEYTRMLSTEMKISGYVPRLDILEDFTIDYNETTKSFKFELSIYGVYLGRKKSECIQGIDGNKIVYIQKSKSSESLQAQELPLSQK